MLDKITKKNCGSSYTYLNIIPNDKFSGKRNEEIGKTKTHSDTITSVNPHLTS